LGLNEELVAETMASPLVLAVCFVAAVLYFYGLGGSKKSHVQAGLVKKQPIKRAVDCGGEHQPWRDRQDPAGYLLGSAIASGWIEAWRY
jgi:hypothetical protein